MSQIIIIHLNNCNYHVLHLYERRIILICPQIEREMEPGFLKVSIEYIARSSHTFDDDNDILVQHNTNRNIFFSGCNQHFTPSRHTVRITKADRSATPRAVFPHHSVECRPQRQPKRFLPTGWFPCLKEENLHQLAVVFSGISQ